MVKPHSFKMFSKAEIFELLHDSALIKFAKSIDAFDVPSLLDLLECGFTRCEVSRAIAKGLATFDITQEMKVSLAIQDREQANVILDNEKYQKILGCKVRLTELGLYILDCIKGFGVINQPFERTTIPMLAGSVINVPKGPVSRW